MDNLSAWVPPGKPAIKKPAKACALAGPVLSTSALPQQEPA
jgi:hypothetical protein